MSREIFSRRYRTLLGAGFLPLLFNFPALGNPTGGTVTQGSATFSSSGSTFNINQTSASALINWQTFNIGLGETVNVNQPTAESVTFNQINDVNPSQILGNLNANGYVFLENANGFYIGGQAVLTAHGLVLTTAAPATFTDGGPWSFDAPPPSAQIQNYGQINITGGGSAYLIAADIVNNGTICAPGGQIGLYDGETILVSTSPNGQGLSAQVTLPQGSVDNEGKLTADGGSVVAQAQFVNQNGIIQANTAENVNGTIELLGSSSVTLGPNSAISATGDSTATTPSPGGFVVLNAGTSYSDASSSTISVSGNAAGGQGGIVEIFDPEAGSTPIQSTVSGAFAYLVNPFDVTLSGNSTGTSYDANNNLDANFALSDLAAYSQINLLALDNITLNAILQLADQTAPASLSLTAGNDIILNAGSGISAGQNWSLNLTAGTGFIPTSAQPAPTSGSDGIYLYGYNAQDDSYIQAENGNINLWAANEVQVGWSGSSAGSGVVNAGPSSITTIDNGSINVTTVYGDVNTGSDPAGFDYQDKVGKPYTTVDPDLGGISTAAGGNVTISAGGNVISYMPSDSEDGGTGAYGPEAGNVTITAGDNVYGHFVVADGTGTITAGQNIGGVGAASFALSLIDGGWIVNTPNGNIYLQEVRNPNGVFNDTTGLHSYSAGEYLFNYNPQDYVDLTANGVYLTGLNVPRPYADVPILYPPILDISAGSGGVTLENNITLFPSTYQNLDITTTDGGNFISTGGSSTPYELLMSDSASSQWQDSISFTASDHGTLANEPDDSLPVSITISGNMEDLNLITTKATDILVDGSMINCGFSGQNLLASDITSIIVGGEIYNTSPYAFVDLTGAIPTIPAGDLLPGMASSWDNVFALAVNATLLSEFSPSQIPSDIPVSQWATYILSYNSLFQGGNPGFTYDATDNKLGYTGTMAASYLSDLTQTITVLHLVNGEPVVNPTTGQFETDTITWVNTSALAALSTASQGDPALDEVQLGYRIGGPGQFDIDAGSISLGSSDGIISSGIYDPQGGYNRYSNLASITPEGATLNVTASGDLEMLSSTIASLDGGDVNVTSLNGSMDLGSTELQNSTGGVGDDTGTHLMFGIYTTGGGNVSVTADGDVDIDGSRIATYDGGDIVVESLTGDVDIGDGTPDLNTIDTVYNGEALDSPYGEDAFGSGIQAKTLVPAQTGQAFPANAAAAPGNITVETPQGDILASTAGIIQEALDGSIAPGPQVLIEAGTPYNDDWTPYLEGMKPSQTPIYVGNINLGDSGVIGGDVIEVATGSVYSQGIISRQNATVVGQQSVIVTILSGGQVNVAAGQSVSGTIAGVNGVTVNAGGPDTATALGQNVSVNGGASVSTLGSSATASSATQSAAQQANSQSQQQVAADQTTQEDNSKKKKPQIRVGRVTVILSAAVPE